MHTCKYLFGYLNPHKVDFHSFKIAGLVRLDNPAGADEQSSLRHTAMITSFALEQFDPGSRMKIADPSTTYHRHVESAKRTVALRLVVGLTSLEIPGGVHMIYIYRRIWIVTV